LNHPTWRKAEGHNDKLSPRRWHWEQNKAMEYKEEAMGKKGRTKDGCSLTYGEKSNGGGSGIGV